MNEGELTFCNFYLQEYFLIISCYKVLFITKGQFKYLTYISGKNKNNKKKIEVKPIGKVKINSDILRKILGGETELFKFQIIRKLKKIINEKKLYVSFYLLSKII